jgi:hypothetical protein
LIEIDYTVAAIEDCLRVEAPRSRTLTPGASTPMDNPTTRLTTNSPTDVQGVTRVWLTKSLPHQVLSIRSIELSNDLATRFLNFREVPGARKIRDNNTQHLYDDAIDGRLRWSDIVLGTCELGGSVYKLRGQHACWTRLRLRDTSTPVVRMIRYRVETQEQLAALYWHFDPGTPPTDAEIFQTALARTPAGEGLLLGTITTLAGAVRFWRAGEMDGERAAVVARYVRDHYFNTFNRTGRFIEALSPKARALLRHRPTQAAMLDTFSTDASAAVGFWGGVAEGVNLNRDCGRWHLREYLIDTALRRKNAGTIKKVVEDESVYRTCVTAWNRWRRGEKVASLRPTARRTPSL